MTTNIIKSIKPKITTCSCCSSSRQTKLDNYTESVREIDERTTPNQRILRNRINILQDKNVGKKLLTDQESSGKINTRHTYCGYSAINSIASIEKIETVNHKNQKQTKFHIGGTAQCKQIWRCPTCSIKLLKGRAKEIYDLTKAHQKQGYKLGFVTLTIRHNKNDSLQKSLDKLLNSYRKFQRLKIFKDLRVNKLLGQIKSCEITITKKNGFHPHLHIIYFYKTNDLEYIEIAQEKLIKDWANYTGGLQKAQDQKIVYTDKEITEYITKWDLSQELTNDHNKTPKGIKPFQLLSKLSNNELLFDHTDIKKSNQHVKRLWLEYVETTKGKRRITTSPILNKLYKIDEKTDDQILSEKPESQSLVLFSKATWKTIYKNNLQPFLLHSCTFYKEPEKQRQNVLKFLSELDNYTMIHQKDEIPIIFLTSELN